MVRTVDFVVGEGEGATMTNLFFLSVVLTNWISVSGDFKRESGTNYVKQVQLIQTNTYVVEVVLCTNRTLYKQSSSTNGPTRWVVQPMVNLPPPPALHPIP